MNQPYNEAIWGPVWIWVFGLLVFLSGVALVLWFLDIARHADSEAESNAAPRRVS